LYFCTLLSNAMFRQYLILFILICMFFPACKKQDGFILFHTLPNHTWSRFEKQEFDLMIDDISRPFDMYLIMRHDDTYPFDTLYINVIMEMPDGEERIAEYDFDVKDARGEFLSEKKDGYREITYVLRKGIRFNRQGQCSVEIENLIPRIEITGIRELGIRLERSKEK
jgi:gliding motility-associated lipoprotein GldH